MARFLRGVRWITGGILVLALMAGALAYFMLQSRPGHDFFLRLALNQLPQLIEGEVEIGALRSDGLLRGFSLHRVSISDTEGRPFVEADSMRVRYSARELLRREIVLVPAEAWGLRVTIETLHGDSVSNVGRIFPPSDAPEDIAGPGISLSLRQVEVFDAELLLRLPIEEGEGVRGGVVEGSVDDGGLYQIYRLMDLNARIAEASLRDPQRRGEHIVFNHLSFTGLVLAEPFHIEDFRGEVARDGARLSLLADRLWFPGSELHGEATLDWGDPDLGVVLEADMEAEVLSLADFQWFDSRIPDGTGRLSLTASGPLSELQVRIAAADIEVGESRIQGAVGFDLGPELQIVGADVEFLPLDLATVNAWLEEPLPLDGRARGRVLADGPLSAMRLEGELSYEAFAAAEPPATMRFDGFVHLGEAPGVSDFSLVVEPLQYESVRAFFPEAEIVGEGWLRAEASGRLTSGLDVVLEAEHETSGGLLSRVTMAGTIQQTPDDIHLAIEGVFDPLSLDGLSVALERELPISGWIAGPFEAEGFLSDLSLSGVLSTPQGSMELSARLNARDPAAGYEAAGSVEAFRLDTLVEALRDPSEITGEFSLVGAGANLEEVTGVARLDLRASQLSGIAVEEVLVALRAVDGRLILDEMLVASPVFVLSGSGNLALREDEPDGDLSVAWESESLAALRPVLLGEDPIAGDTLTSLEREILRFEGIDPDTLDRAEHLELDGMARGEIHLHGSIRNLTADGFVDVSDLVLGATSLAAGRADFVGRWEGGSDWSVEGVLDLDRLAVEHLAFQRGSGEVSYRPGAGSFRMDVQREVADAYRARGEFSHDSLGVEVDLAMLAFEVDDVAWILAEPANLRIAGSMFEVDNFRLVRPDEGVGTGMRIEARGILHLEGESEFQVEIEAVDLDRLQRVTQWPSMPAGVLNLSLDVSGPATSPEMAGHLLIRDFSMNGAALSRVEGTVAYTDRILTTELAGEFEGRPLLTVDGQIPVDLSFRPVEDRIPLLEADIAIGVEALPIATVLAFVEALEEVDGTLDGQVHVRGTLRDLQPSGELQLRDGSVFLSELGLRLTDIGGDFRVRENAEIDVTLQARSGGAAQVSGTIDMGDATNPGFDLLISAGGLQAVDRRDLTARIGGEVSLTGSFAAPRVGGQVRVEQGSLYLEEFARTAEVVDLTDPAFFDVVDTTLVAVRPVVEAAQNPFLQNLRVDVDLALQSDFWLRSREINTEIGGELVVIFDRARREILLVGTLETVRGTYNSFGRQFQVEEGVVEFMGTPGIDPALNIQAVTRLRREGGVPLNITANVEGTLMRPEVRLSTDSQPPIAESDLISYLIFGRPSYALGSGETSVLQGAAGAGVSMGIGTIASQLGSVVARQFGVDYFTITQAQEEGGLAAAAGLSGSFAGTQIEVGQYVGQNLFLALVLRPLTGLGAGSQNQLPGARLEWRFTDAWSMEGFVEDRFAREAASGFGELGLRLSKVMGLSLFREWGY